MNLLTGNFEHTTFFSIVLCVVYSLGPNLSSHTHFYLKLPERKEERRRTNNSSIHVSVLVQYKKRKNRLEVR
jgi:hypothetical protein